MKTTLKDFAAGSRVFIDHGAGIETDACLIIKNTFGTLDAAIGGKGFIPVVRLSDGLLWMKLPDRPAIPAPSAIS